MKKLNEVLSTLMCELRDRIEFLYWAKYFHTDTKVVCEKCGKVYINDGTRICIHCRILELMERCKEGRDA